MCTPVGRESASYSRRSRPWNMPVLSTIVRPPCSRKSVSFAARVSKISARSMRDVEGVLGSRHHGQQRFVNRDDPQVVGGRRVPSTVLTVVLAALCVAVIGTSLSSAPVAARRSAGWRQGAVVVRIAVSVSALQTVKTLDG